MRRIIQLFILISMGLVAGDEGILPRQLTVDLPKNCQVLMLHETRDRKSKLIVTHAAYGDKVENMGCIRDITQKKIDETPKEKRYYVAWKYPVWCRVAFGKKEGWVLQQYLKNKDLKEESDDF